MRPKKRILIYGADEETASILRIVVESKGRYAVTVAAAFARPWVWKQSFDVYLLVGTEKVILGIPKRILRKHSASICVVVPRRGMIEEGVWMSDLLNRLYLAQICKRGPKPQRLAA